MEGARLLLHFEVDEILLAGDVEERVNAALARAAVVARKGRPASASDVASRSSSASAHRADPFGDFNWHDGSPLDLLERAQVEFEQAKTKKSQLIPPRLVRTVNAVSCKQGQEPSSMRFMGLCPKGCETFDQAFPQHSRLFTTVGPGKIYLPAALDLLQLIRWPSLCDPVPDLAWKHKYNESLTGQMGEQNGVAYQLLLPSFLQLLVRLMDQGRSHAIVLHSHDKSKLDLIATALDAFALGRHPLFAKALGYINPTHLRCRDEVHWRVEISFAQEPAPGSEVPEDSEEPAGSQTGANAPVDALLGQDDDNGTSLISLRSRSESFSDLGEYAADEYILKAHTAIGLHNGSADQDDKSPRASSCRPMWFTAENNTAHPIAFGGRGRMTADAGGEGTLTWTVRWRRRKTDCFQTLDERRLQMLHDTLLFEVDLVQALLDPQYFVLAVEHCEMNLRRLGRHKLLGLITRNYGSK